MRIMGLDYGKKRIGVAVSDPLGWIAQGVEVVVFSSLASALERIMELIKEYETERIVVGLPVNMNGSYGPSAEAAKEFAGRLTAVTGLPVEFWDERLTTVEAEKLLVGADINRAKRRQVIDKIAAALILQGYLDRRQQMTAVELDTEFLD